VYKINIVEEDSYIITNDRLEQHWFSYNEEDQSYYKKWFYSLKDIRKKKLEKLKND